ncbi:gluconate 2-dehydrogenase subunit 3 family protein [Azospirillum endophyticum]
MSDRYPGYDVLAKRDGPSWNDQTRAVVDRRLAVGVEDHRFFAEAEWRTLRALCDRILPQPPERDPPVPVAALLDLRLRDGPGDGYRDVALPAAGIAWKRALAALEAESRRAHGRSFPELAPGEQDALLRDMQEGRLADPAWQGMPPQTFFSARLMYDLVSLYYSHPAAWNEIGFGGPASPRGYVRMGFDRRDPWEAAEAAPGEQDAARRENRHVR